MKVGICSIIWKERLDIFEVVATAARVRADGIEVWGQAPHVPDLADHEHLKRIREAMQSEGLVAPQFGSYVRAGTDGFREQAAVALAATEAIGAPACRMWAGPADSEVLDAHQWEAVIADLQHACAVASDKGLLITLERHGNTPTNSLWGCQRVLDEVASTALRINYQVMRTQSDRVAEEIRILAPHILNTHATNARSSDGGRSMTALADGDVDWTALVAALAWNGNDGFVEVEFVRRGTEEISLEKTERELAADVAFLRRVME